MDSAFREEKNPPPTAPLPRRSEGIAHQFFGSRPGLASGEGKFSSLSGRRTAKEAAGVALQRRTAREAAPAPNRTGLPDALKAGIESLSGLAMDDVRVHYNSAKPAQLQALAYTQGSQIHVAPGQERHLPHEAWHVVQQKQGRVRATTQMKGVGVNDEPALEAEADRMGARASAMNPLSSPKVQAPQVGASGAARTAVAQMRFFDDEIINNYDAVVRVWSAAFQRVLDFDEHIENAQRQHSWRRDGGILVHLRNNVLGKSRRAKGTMSGEAYETHLWRVDGHWIDGPGGPTASTDIRRFIPGSGNILEHRNSVEVKTALDIDSLKSGLHNAIHAGNGFIKAYYHGPIETIDTMFNFTRDGRAYREVAFNPTEPPANFAQVEVYNSTGQPLRRFGLSW